MSALRREEEHLVAFLDDRVAFRRNAAAAAVDGDHPRLHAGQMLRQLAQAMADQQAAAHGAHTDQAHLAGGEVEHLQRAGMADEPLDVFGDQLLRADEHIDRDRLLAEELRPLGVLGGADAGDLGRRPEQCERHLAGHHVDFVAVGQGDDDLRLRGACRFENRRVGGVADDGVDVEAVLEVAQDVLVEVDDGDFVGLFPREMPGDGAADLAGAENENLHSFTSQTGSRLAYCIISHFVPCRSKFTCTRACGPLPSTFNTTPSPNLPCRTRAPRRIPGGGGSLSPESDGGRRRLLAPRVRRRWSG